MASHGMALLSARAPMCSSINKRHLQLQRSHSSGCKVPTFVAVKFPTPQSLDSGHIPCHYVGEELLALHFSQVMGLSDTR